MCKWGRFQKTQKCVKENRPQKHTKKPGTSCRALLLAVLFFLQYPEFQVVEFDGFNEIVLMKARKGKLLKLANVDVQPDGLLEIEFTAEFGHGAEDLFGSVPGIVRDRNGVLFYDAGSFHLLAPDLKHTFFPFVN